MPDAIVGNGYEESIVHWAFVDGTAILLGHTVVEANENCHW